MYEGEWKNNKPYGEGQFIHYEDGQKFAGKKNFCFYIFKNINIIIVS